MTKPYFNASIRDLEQLVSNSSDKDVLRSVFDELENRTSTRAEKLKDELAEKLGLNKHDRQSETKPSLSFTATPQSSKPSTDLRPEDLDREHAMTVKKPEIARLASWIALEALSPQTFKTPEALASDERRRIAPLSAGLPWLNGEQPRPEHRLFYEVVLGAIDMGSATKSLVSVFGHDEERDRPSQEKAVIGSVLVDETGLPVEENGIAISSFAWALPLSLNKRFSVLSTWPDVEQDFRSAIREMITRTDKDGNRVPVDELLINQVHDWIVKRFKLPPELVVRPEFAIRHHHHFKAANPPECSLLNSFFLEDLADAAKKFERGTLGEGIKRYLTGQAPGGVRDLLLDEEALEDSVAPKMFPASRWSMGSDRALVLLQQAAVNSIRSELSLSGIAAVNGPPGTGKTTLLRDVVSQVIVDRASGMASFGDPTEAFKATGQEIPTGGQGVWQIHELDDRLKGHEMLIASSNNAAVENISRELPGLDAVADPDLAYFRTVSDCIAASVKPQNHKNAEKPETPNPKTWGLISAALGNMKNRARFTQTFWWHEEFGFRLYLKAAKGDSVVRVIKDPKTGEIIARRPPEIVLQEAPPTDKRSALKNWSIARTEFLELKEDVERDFETLESIRQKCLLLVQERKELARLQGQLTETGNALAAMSSPTSAYAQQWPKVVRRLVTEIDSFLVQKSVAPAWYHRWFGFKKGKLWKRLLEQYRAFGAKRLEISDLQDPIAAYVQETGSQLIDQAFFGRSHADKQIASPWISDALNAKRERLFALAMKVHRAFIDANAQKLLHNLSVLLGPYPESKKRAHLVDLWSSLFLVVPVLSTAFASVNRMLGDLPPESLGWVLIDEAGQAVPQAAVGAIMRAKRSVIVGDPIQVQPVVTLPQRLVDGICEHFGVDPTLWAGPTASVQTLADQVSQYQSGFSSDTGVRSIGVPLLVHRRCEDPMFSISNEAAYNNQMVSQVAESDGGDIRRILGRSS
ncbi:MAG: AAA domain-containing protein [Pseudomonadota bacterium]